MATFLIEQGRRVFELTTTPDTPGYCRRRAVLRQVAGEPLTQEEWEYVTTRAVVEMVALGVDVVSWGGGEDDDDG